MRHGKAAEANKEVMPLGKTRALNTKYGISKHRFRELYYWCLQYNEWKDELKYKTDTVKAVEAHDMPREGQDWKRIAISSSRQQ